MQLCYGHALSCTELAFRHATETHLELEVANKDEEKKSWLSTERGLGFQTAGNKTWTRDFRVSSPALWPLDHAAKVLICVATQRHTYCSSTNQCLQTLTTEKKKDSHFKTRSLSGTSNNNIAIFKYIGRCHQTNNVLNLSQINPGETKQHKEQVRQVF